MSDCTITITVGQTKTDTRSLRNASQYFHFHGNSDDGNNFRAKLKAGLVHPRDNFGGSPRSARQFDIPSCHLEYATHWINSIGVRNCALISHCLLNVSVVISCPIRGIRLWNLDEMGKHGSTNQEEEPIHNKALCRWRPPSCVFHIDEGEVNTTIPSKSGLLRTCKQISAELSAVHCGSHV